MLKTPFSDYFHFPEQSTENSTKLYEKKKSSKLKVCQNGITHLVYTEIFSNRWPLFIRQPTGVMALQFESLSIMNKELEKEISEIDYLMYNLLAFASQTQQWTPRLPLYTQRMWLKPKSSAKNYLEQHGKSINWKHKASIKPYDHTIIKKYDNKKN